MFLKSENPVEADAEPVNVETPIGLAGLDLSGLAVGTTPADVINRFVRYIYLIDKLEEFEENNALTDIYAELNEDGYRDEDILMGAMALLLPQARATIRIVETGKCEVEVADLPEQLQANVGAQLEDEGKVRQAAVEATNSLLDALVVLLTLVEAADSDGAVMPREED